MVGRKWRDEGKVAFYVRSGNTSTPEEQLERVGGSLQIRRRNCELPSGAIRAVESGFSGTDQAAAADISWVSLAYQPKNVAPVIDDIVVKIREFASTGFPLSLSGPGNAASSATAISARTPERIRLCKSMSADSSSGSFKNRSASAGI